MLDKDTERLLGLAHSPAYRAFGFGTDAFGFAKRLLTLHDENPDAYRRLHDVADRLEFVDFLRFEIGWETERLGSDVSECMRHSFNLDALETYLLCTCVDALAGLSYSPFPEWVVAHPDEVLRALGGLETIAAQQYSAVTKRLFESYNKSAGLGRNFRQFFMDLPDFVKREIAEGIVLIKGDYWTAMGQRRVEAWSGLALDTRVESIAKHYLWGVRRSSYTHACNRQVALREGQWRRLAASGAMPSEPTGWALTKLRRANDPERVEWTVISHASRDEGFLLRAAMAVRVLTTELGYCVGADYVQAFLRCYQAMETIHAFVREMEANTRWLDLLMVPQTITEATPFWSQPLLRLSTTVGEKLLEDSRDYVDMLAQDIGSYLHNARQLNAHIDEFNSVHEPSAGDWQGRRLALAAFSQGLLLLGEPGWIRWYEQRLRPELKRQIESGQVFYRFAGLVEG